MRCENVAKNCPTAKARQKFCDNLWKIIIMALEKPGKLTEFFFSYFVTTLYDCWHFETTREQKKP